MTNTYEIGDRIGVRTAEPFQGKETGLPFDPPVVRFEIKAPGVATVAYVYGADANVIRLATGDYICEIDIDTSGLWYYYIIGEAVGGQNRGAHQDKFNVRKKST